MSASESWVNQWFPAIGRETLLKRMKITPEPFDDLGQYPLMEAVRRLDDQMKLIFHPTAQCLDFAEALMGIMRAGAIKRYSSLSQYQGLIHAKTFAEPDYLEPVAFTGHAGVGKSALIHAIHRALAPSSSLEGAMPGTGLPFRPVLHLVMKTNRTLKPAFESLGASGGKLGDLRESAQRLLFRDRVLLLSVDEFQFLTQSSEASSTVMQFLHAFAYLGIPWVYASNFSLIRKLQSRPPEDRQRVLSQVWLMMPELPGSEDANDTIRNLLAIAPTVFDIHTDEHLERVWTLSWGLRRAQRRLLVTAYGIAREGAGKSPTIVTIAHLEKAYKAANYSEFRNDIEAIKKLAGSNYTNNTALVCPYDAPFTAADAYKVHANEQREKAVAEAAMKASMTPEERRIVQSRYDEKVSKRKSGSERSSGQSRRPNAAEAKSDSEWMASQFS